MNLSGTPPFPMPETAPLPRLSTPQTGRLRLLEALDALLAHGGVSEAARALAISPPAMSRLLGQLRAHYGDPLLVRAGNRRMVPTPFALRLRERVHLFKQSADLLLAQGPDDPAASPLPRAAHEAAPVPAGTTPPGLRQMPLATPGDRAPEQPDGSPARADVLRRLEGWIRSPDPQTRLAGLVSALAGGQAVSRSLRTDEAAEAMAIILRGQAEAVQVGAFLAALQLRGPTGEELAGMVQAARDALPPPPRFEAALDWPAYASPRNQRIPWFLLAVRALAEAGYRVALHGAAHPGDIKLHIARSLGIPVAQTPGGAARHLRDQRCVYVPLGILNPQLQALNGLYGALGMRNASHLAVQLLNPLHARATVLGVPSQHGQSVHRDAMIVLGKGRLLSISTHRDIAQGTPHRLLRYALVDGGRHSEQALPASTHRRPPGMVPGQRAAEQCLAAWNGQLRDEEISKVITDTIALGLIAAGAADSADPTAARATARDLWNARQTSRPCLTS